MKITLPSIQHNQQGFTELARLNAQTTDCHADDIEIDMKSAAWFDADMCAALGAILYRLESNLNVVNLTNISSGVEEILSKNGFLSHYGRTYVSDHWGTTISYQRFDVEDNRYFADYIEDEFISRSEMPEMSHVLLKKFRESIFEIFSNAVLHSRTQLGIFSCGQFFPNQHRLDFTVADLGVGIPENVREHIDKNLSPEEAIEWAIKERHTTKRSKIPGGLGLSLLQEFIDLNRGRICIASDIGYWCRQNRQTHTELLDYPFPGTVVNVEINTADQHSYALASEIDAADIF